MAKELNVALDIMGELGFLLLQSRVILHVSTDGLPDHGVLSHEDD